MKIELKPVKVSHVSIKAILLYEQELAKEYERIYKTYVGVNKYNDNSHEMKALKKIETQMKDCQAARAYLEKHWVNQQEPEDKTQY